MQNAVRSELRSAVGHGRVTAELSILSAYAFDGLRPYRAFPKLPTEGFRPDVIVYPRTTQDVVEIMKIAISRRIPVVPYAGGTGLMGGAAAVRRGIIVDLTKMNAIQKIDKANLTATVQPGVVLGDLSKALKSHDLILAHDPWTLPIATVGGAISTNSLGYLGAKYGAIGNQVISLEAVLPNAKLVNLGRARQASTGFDLRYLLIGSEGCFGIITAAVLQVFPNHESEIGIAFGFRDFESGFSAILALEDCGLEPAVLDFGQGGEANAPSMLYLRFLGCAEIIQAQVRKAKGICSKKGGSAMTREAAESFWLRRHDIARRYQRRWRRRTRWAGRRKFDFLHVSIPRGKVLRYKEDSKKIMIDHGVRIVEQGIWHHPELFSMALEVVGSNSEVSSDTLFSAIDEALMLAQDFGGTMEYCHGVGIRLAHLMEREIGASGLETLRALKRAIDPYDIMNPGKLGL